MPGDLEETLFFSVSVFLETLCFLFEMWQQLVIYNAPLLTHGTIPACAFLQKKAKNHLARRLQFEYSTMELHPPDAGKLIALPDDVLTLILEKLGGARDAIRACSLVS